MRMLPVYLFVLCLLASQTSLFAEQEGQISRLEAVHVAETHTGSAASGVMLDRGPTGTSYRVDLVVGGFARVDAQHGRLLELRGMPGQQAYDWPGIRVVAHRGGVSLGPPENTLPAISRAISVGADLIEVDIRETSDGHLVLMHDRTVDRTTNGRGAVDQLSFADVRGLSIIHGGSDVIRVPTLGEALALMKGKIDADLDFKEGDFRKIIEVVRAYGMEDHVTMHASWERCAELARLEPRIRIRPTVQHPGQVRDLVKQLRPAMVNFDWHSVTEESVRDAHLGGCLAFVNCLESADTDFYVEEAIRIGADYIQSDRPNRVLEILRERGLRGREPILGAPLGTPLRNKRLGYPLR